MAISRDLDVEPEVEEEEEEAEPPEENSATAPPQRAELPVKLGFLKVACFGRFRFQHRVRAGIGESSTVFRVVRDETSTSTNRRRKNVLVRLCNNN